MWLRERTERARTMGEREERRAKRVSQAGTDGNKTPSKVNS